MPTEQNKAELLMKELFLSAQMNLRLYISPLSLRQMYRQYSKWRQLIKSRNGWWNTNKEKERIYAFNRCLVHYLLERCFWISYGDSDIVSDLLIILYETDGHLGKIFDCKSQPVKPLSSEKNKSKSGTAEEEVNEEYTLKSTWKKELLEQRETKPIDYFMRHANKKKILFDHQRFAEQCILRCKIKTASGSTDLLFHPPCSMFFKTPDIFSNLLQHGLFAKADPYDENVGRLLTGVLGIWASGGLDTKPSDSTLMVLELADMLLRAVKSVHISVLLAYQRVRKRSVTIPNIVRKASSEKILPKLEVRCLGPQELQHLCRWQIRMRLYENWQLPDGIGFLPIPKYFQRYLHLIED